MATPPYYTRAVPAYNFGATKQVVASAYARPADNTAYTAGDIIGNSGTAASVIPITFANAARVTGAGATGRVKGARCVVTPTSGNVVITAFDFDLLLFRPATSIPFAAAGYPADNAALTLTTAMYKELIGVVPFVNGAWRNPLGALTASTVGFQEVTPNVMSPLPFDFSDLTSASIIAVMQAKAAWTPTGVINTFDFTLFVEQD